jgi:peptidoglycan/LPS O-acetylase OafA/YrhL
VGYRKDIQVLRGIAVTLVVLFHLDIAGFNSGFLGVDVFFVISGYLMALLYDPEHKREFFAKRARRLLPAYFATVLFTLVAALLLTVPSDYAQVADQSVFAALFASNIGFWAENSYFDKAAFKPLLHLWSLGVEIQFYLLVPALYWLFRKSRLAYPILLVGSALVCFAVVGVSPKTSFFWLPLRLWQFLIGFGIAKYVYRGKDEHFGWIGFPALVAIVCIPILRVDGNALDLLRGHPGAMSALISVATAVTLAFGIPKRIEDSMLAGLMERLGHYSYSIYLAHFPVIVLFLYQPFAGTLIKTQSIAQAALLAALVAGASAVLYAGIERPLRRTATPSLFRRSAAAIAVVVCIGQLGFLVQRLRTPESEMLIYEAWTDRDVYRCGKLHRIIHPSDLSCEIGGPVADPVHRVLLVGNSHADSIKSTFTSAAHAQRVAVYFMVENNPLMPGGSPPQEVMQEALSRRIDSIVMHYSPGGVRLDALEELAMLAEESGIALAFIMPVPIWDRHIPKALLATDSATPSQDIGDYRAANAELINALDHARFRVYQTADVLCRSSCKTVAESGRPLYFDAGHLTLTGSNLLRGTFDQVIADLLASSVTSS